jgi:hypothetical protein
MALTKPKSSRLGWFGRHKIISTILLIIVLVTGYFVYEKIAYQMNKHAFAETKSSIDTVYSNIISKVGSPDDKRNISTCSPVREVYGNGSTSCTLIIDFIYPVNNKREADDLRVRMQNTVSQNSNLLKPVQNPSTNSQVNTSSRSDSEPATDYFRAKGGVPCRIDYIYNPTFNTELNLKERGKQNFYISIDCFGHSRGIYYSTIL